VAVVSLPSRVLGKKIKRCGAFFVFLGIFGEARGYAPCPSLATPIYMYDNT